MSLSIDELPNDVESLKALLLAVHAASQAAEARAASLAVEVDRLTARAERLDHIVSVLRRAQFGRRSERISEAQIELALEDVETQHGTEDAAAEKTSDIIRAEGSKARRANRGHLPTHLPREEIVIEPEAKACPCCGGALHVIGEDVSERLDKIPARLRVIVTRRPKYASRSCTDGVIQAPAPHRLIEGGLPTEALVADVLVSKYADHLPLYRQAQILAREGVRIDRSTLAHWVGFAAFELAPLHDRLVHLLKTSTKLFADETRCPVLDPGRGKTKTGYLWAIARDDRPWGGSDPPAVAYTYAPGRGAEHAATLLSGFSGVLQVDGYAGYDSVARLRQDRQADARRPGGPLVLAYCWSHFRRRFYDIAKAGNAPIASEALRRIGELYAIEAEISGRSANERRANRQARTQPLVEALRIWLDEQLERVPGRSPVAEAMRYGTNHWQGLCRFLDDGRVEIDTNVVERAIRPIALRRKNALFAGSDEGGANWAIIASLIENCKLNSVNPHAWLADTLTKLVYPWPASRIDDLMPWTYAKIPA
ncbi:MAG: IS66 family transposase [Hyphomicrobiaceae bacterium]|nr:IS66 family transposase [Hyphomicrobiaceae bacterium]